MSDQSDGSLEDSADDGQEEEKKVDLKFDENGLRKKLPKHMRLRYWHSWEEMRLIELWRKNFHEVTTLKSNLPVFRTISAGMKDTGFIVSGQEVRRKINSLKNKYIAERRRLIDRGNPDGVSSWPLYKMVHCIMTNPPSINSGTNEEELLKSIYENHKANPLYHILLAGMPVIETLDRIEAGEEVEILPPKKHKSCFPAEENGVATSIAYAYQNKHRLSYTPRTHRPSEIAALQARANAAAQRARAMTVLNTSIRKEPPDTPMSTSTIPQGSIPRIPKNMKGRTPLKRYATMQSILEKRANNRHLVEEVLIAGKQLKAEEQELKMLEQIFQSVETQLTDVFQRL